MLYDKGVSLNQTDENGCTPLHYAALTHQQYDLAKFFVGKIFQNNVKNILRLLLSDETTISFELLLITIHKIHKGSYDNPKNPCNETY